MQGYSWNRMSRAICFATVLSLACIAFSCGADSGNHESKTEPDWGTMRREMVVNQIEARGVRDPRVLAAMMEVERHKFVPSSQQRAAYEDGPLPIGSGQTISQPYIVALMSELAKLDPDARVLEIGTGSGYQAAVLSAIASEVYSIEIIESLGNQARLRLAELGFKNVQVRIGDGYQGWPEHAPFDAILVTAAPDHVPQPLVDQLKIGGRLVIPVGDFYQELEVITRTENGVATEKVIPVRFVPMTGEAESKQ